MLIHEFLKEGAGNATPLRELKPVTGLDDRTFRLLVERERREGIPICSSSEGYFLAADDGEVERFIRSMRHRAGEILKTAAALERRD